MAAITIIEFDRGFQTTQRGSLLNCPAEILALSQMAFYQACKVGWSKCPLGFSVYAAFDAMGRKLVVPGVIVPGDVSPRRKFPDYKVRFSREQIESFLRPHLNVSDEIRVQRDTEFKNLTHDLRAMGAAIYNEAYNARRLVESLG